MLVIIHPFSWLSVLHYRWENAQYYTVQTIPNREAIYVVGLWLCLCPLGGKCNMERSARHPGGRCFHLWQPVVFHKELALLRTICLRLQISVDVLSCQTCILILKTYPIASLIYSNWGFQCIDTAMFTHSASFSVFDVLYFNERQGS